MNKIKYVAFVLVGLFGISACAPKADRTAEMREKLEIGEIPSEVDVFSLNAAQSEVAWEGKKITGSGHNGTIAVKGGELYVYNGQLLGGKVEIDMTQIVVVDIEDPESNGRLKGHLESDDFFSVASHPVATLEIADVQPIEGAAAGAPNHKITGNLTIKGITHGIVFDANINIGENRIQAVSDFAFDRAAYDVRFRSGRFFENLGDNLILDDINLSIDVVAAM